MEEVRARHDRMILVGSDKDPKIASHVIRLPEVHELLNPILYTIPPPQLLAYQIAALRVETWANRETWPSHRQNNI